MNKHPLPVLILLAGCTATAKGPLDTALDDTASAQGVSVRTPAEWEE